MGKLFLVPTPIGNMGDITFRALEILKYVSIILCEDTRVSLKLLSHYDIKTPCKSYHQHNEHQVLSFIIDELKQGKDMAVITDAGTPGISDPGFLLSRACIDAEIEVECLPGATAFVPALVQSALPCERFIFEGFLPHQKGRNARLESIRFQERTMVFYESPHRLLKTLEQLSDTLGGDRKACVCREISKIYAESNRDSLANLSEYYKQNPPKGEIVIVVNGREQLSYTYAYPRPAVTVDIIFTLKLQGKENYILLIKRAKEPFANSYALPGGFVEEDETLEWAAGRELKEETGLWFKDWDVVFMPFRPYSNPDRDPRGRTITMVYTASVEADELPVLQAADDASEASWFNLNELPALAFDHKQIIEEFKITNLK